MDDPRSPDPPSAPDDDRLRAAGILSDAVAEYHLRFQRLLDALAAHDASPEARARLDEAGRAFERHGSEGETSAARLLVAGGLLRLGLQPAMVALTDVREALTRFLHHARVWSVHPEHREEMVRAAMAVEAALKRAELEAFAVLQLESPEQRPAAPGQASDQAPGGRDRGPLLSDAARARRARKQAE